MVLCFAEFKVILEEENFLTLDSVSGACERSQSRAGQNSSF